jgi:hypothetical protein
MKNVKVKIKNVNRNGKWGNEEEPMLAGCSARGAGAGAQDGDVQSPGSKVQSQVAGEAEFEDWRLKMSIGEEHGMENGKSRTRTTTRTRMKNRNDGGMANGALCLIVPPNSCGRARDRRGKAPSPRHRISGSMSGRVGDGKESRTRTTTRTITMALGRGGIGCRHTMARRTDLGLIAPFFAN